ncbi:MAG TPA: peptidase S41, partial [Chryseolinea sp.]|nr:peptidase S41 [Chryseolinea sp.]
MKLRLLFVAICFPGFTFGQTDTLQQFTLTPDQARCDFRLYRRLLQETHPGLYRYTQKEQMQQFLDSVDASFMQTVAFYDYQRLLALVNAKIRCAHSSALPQNFSGFTGSVKILPL